MTRVVNVMASGDAVLVDPTIGSTLTASAGGEVTVTGTYSLRYHLIDTDGSASLAITTINGGNAGERLILRAANDARTPVMTDGAGLIMQGDFSLDDQDDTIHYVCISSGVWQEISRSSVA